MFWVVFSVSLVSTVLAITSLFIYSWLIYGLFVSKKLKKSNSLTLFYARFFIDAFLSVGNLLMLVIAYIQLSPSRQIIDNNSTFIVFFIAWPLVELICIRGFLVSIITLDRTFAVFFPVSYHNYRAKVPNVAIIVVVFSYSGWENILFWVVCKYKVNVPPGCITFDCIGNMCYLSYFLGYEMIVHALIALLSLFLVIKIFVWNKFSNPSENKDLTKANRLALIDAFIIFAFDVTPAVIMVKFENVKFDDVGPILSFTKMGGYAIEGYLVIRALKRKNEIETENNKSLSLVQVKPSHGT
ncbi:unnamed protein product [Caenorhabditis brenneri]